MGYLLIIFPSSALSILRMVKLLGWEPPLNKDISDKRKDEIKAVKKSKLLVLLIAHVKYVQQLVWTAVEPELILSAAS